MSIVLHKPYLVKLSTKQRGEGVKNVLKTVHMVYELPLMVIYTLMLQKLSSSFENSEFCIYKSLNALITYLDFR